jgi:hypothetical protein
VFLATDLLGDKANREIVRSRLKERKATIKLTEEDAKQLEDNLVWEENRVALKVMDQLDQFERELSVREFDSSPGEWWDIKDYVTQLAEAHVVNVVRSHRVNHHVR